MQIKPGVRIQGLRPELMLGLMVCEAVYRELDEELVVTSMIDGRHSRGSLHYAGQAADLRISDFHKIDVQLAVSRIKSRIGQDFDIVLERDHIHLEYQPKEPYR